LTGAAKAWAGRRLLLCRLARSTVLGAEPVVGIDLAEGMIDFAPYPE